MAGMLDSTGKELRTTILLCVAGLVVTAGLAPPAAALTPVDAAPVPVGASTGSWAGSSSDGGYSQSFTYLTHVWPTEPAAGAIIHVRSRLTHFLEGPCDPQNAPFSEPRTDATGNTTWSVYRLNGRPAPSDPWNLGLGSEAIAPVGSPTATMSQSFGCGTHTEEFLLDGDYSAPKSTGCYSIAGLNDTLMSSVSGSGTWATFCVKGKNTPPVAVDDPPDAGQAISYESASKGRPKRIDVLSNDTDVDGDPLRVTKVTQPRHGRASVKGGIAVTYTPPARGDTPRQWNGIETFTYTVSDGRGGTDVGRVRVQVASGDCGPIEVKLTLLDPSNPVFTMEHSTVLCSTPKGTRVMSGTMKPQGLGDDASKVKLTQADVSGNRTASVLTTRMLYCQDAYTHGGFEGDSDDFGAPDYALTDYCISVTWKSVVSAGGDGALVTSRLTVQVPPASKGADAQVSLQGRQGLRNDATCAFAKGSWRCRW